jgi:hypothetical protein
VEIFLVAKMTTEVPSGLASAAQETATPAEERRACSACAGDYEDPDRTAWGDEEIAVEEDAAEQREPAEEFPVR